MVATENVNNKYFDGLYKDIWKATVPEEVTKKEVDFILNYFDLSPGSRVLDLMCGYGRHSIPLAEAGLVVNAVDNLSDYINEIRSKASEKGVTITTSSTDVLNFEIPSPVDLVICMGNSFNFFGEEDLISLLKKIANSLTTNGHLLLNTWSLTEIVSNNFTSRGWEDINGVKFLAESKFLFFPSRVETNTIMIPKEGQPETKLAVDYIYSVNELKNLLHNCGLDIVEIFSVPGRKPFTFGDPRAYIVAKGRA